jgi:hypothetical protein
VILIGGLGNGLSRMALALARSSEPRSDKRPMSFMNHGLPN